MYQIDDKKRTGSEPFHENGKPLDLSLLEYWQWFASDLVSNTMRGVLAEFIVASALGLTQNNRKEWDAYDLITQDGIKIEVKSAAYLQSWNQKELSNISFNIKPTHAWNAETGEYSKDKKRSADIYVFCVLNHKDQKTLDPLNLDQWDFYILPTSVINVECGNQKTISLNRLIKLKPYKAQYDDIASQNERKKAEESS